MGDLEMSSIKASEIYEIRTFSKGRVYISVPSEPGIRVPRFGELIHRTEPFEIRLKVNDDYHRLSFMDTSGALRTAPQNKETFETFFLELARVLESDEWVFDKNGFFLRGYKRIQAGQRRVVCAALMYGKNEIICAPRHFDETCHRLLSKVDYYQGKAPIQGFVDQYGQFMDRKEAWKVALEANQIIRICGGNEEGVLYSENLY